MRTMTAAMLAALAVAGGAQAQSQSNAATLPLLAGAQAAPDCGGAHTATAAVCVRTTIGALQTVFDAYVTFFQVQGWTSAGAIDNGLVMTRPRSAGGCDGLQVVAFNDPDQGSAPDSPGYLAVAPLPGDPCARWGARPQTSAQ